MANSNQKAKLKLAGLLLLTWAVGVGFADQVSVKQDQKSVVISAGDKPLCEYRFAEVPFKPYVAQLYTPNGVAVLRDSPEDHKHHHALMFAVAVEGVNFWEEIQNNGRQLSRELKTENAGIRQQLDWTTADDKVVLREERIVKVHHEAGLPATLLTWRSRLQTPLGKDSVTLTGSHYFGLGMRFVTTMDKVGEFTFAAGHPSEVVRGEERLAVAKWCAYSAPAGDKPVTAALFDCPANTRHPARMFTMTQPFAYQSATLNLWKEPLALKSDQPLELVYGVALWDGKTEPAGIEELYQRWLKIVAK